MVLTNNHFEFNGMYYHQLSGTAMGTKLAPSYANLFMSTFEDKYVYTYPQQPTLWKRFIDDIFLIWPHGKESLIRFIEHLNRVHPTIKFTSDISDKEIAFLDLTIYLSYPHLYTRIYTKSTDRHMYLDNSSEHPITLKTPYLSHSSSDWRGSTLRYTIYWRHRYICIYTLGGGITLTIYY